MKTHVRFLTLLLCCLFTTSPVLADAQTPAPSAGVAFQQTLVALTNDDRAVQGEKPLVESPLLDLAAQAKADNMMAQGYFAHYSPLGVSPWYWFTSVGYFYTHAGENLAMNFDDPASVEVAWMASPTHRANILRGLYTHMGIGIAHGTYQGKPTTFVVELFATPVSPVASAKESVLSTKTNPA